MLELPSNVKLTLKKQLPASILNETSCFVFYDHHPLAKKTLDVTVCTSRGEIVELYNRDIVSSLLIETNLKPSQISIFRNLQIGLYYIVQSENRVFIVSSEENELKTIKKLENVDSFDVLDKQCDGQIQLHIKCLDDAVPLILDDRFQIINENTPENTSCQDDNTSIVVELKRKLNSAMYSVAHNENVLKDQMQLRYNVAFKRFQEMHSDLCDPLFHSDFKNVNKHMRVKLGLPWMKLYGDKIVFIIDIDNDHNIDLEDVQVLLQTSHDALTYQTKLFESMNKAPYWNEMKSKFLIKPHTRTSLVLCMKMKNLKNNLESNIELGGLVLYNFEGCEKMMPFQKSQFTTWDTFREELSLLSEELDKKDILALIATSSKTDLIMRHIKNNPLDVNINIMTILSEHLGFEPLLPEVKTAVVHKTSPYHVLHGVVVAFEEGRTGHFEMAVYARSQHQVIALIHTIYDIIPQKIIITTPKIFIKLKPNTQIDLNEDNIVTNTETPNVEGYAKSLITQMDIIKDYYDRCLIKMNESKDVQVKDIIGEEIDLIACGRSEFEEFKRNLNSVINAGVKCLNEKVQKADLENSDSMFMDTDGY